MLHKLILGTAGLSGGPYGRNKRTVTAAQAEVLISEALSCGIDRFDTSPFYGDAENVLRKTLRGRGEVWTKAPEHNEVSLATSRTGAALAHVLVHNWKPRLRDRFIAPQLPQGFDGVTTYSHDLPRHLRFQHRFIQCDWNLLRQTPFFRIFGVRRGCIARSVFLQGALAGGPVPKELQAGVDRAARCASAFNVPLEAFALRAALENPQIDAVVIGPTTPEELYACVNVARWNDIGTQHVISHLDLKRSKHTDPRTFP